ncbi:MAG: AAA family ATPase [Elusimicrobia bacterium RIFOXYA2_FULL_50_26]|nr:MAG: AAA family ATPase [Elusimicrobia bacterium RIFOXYA2_FULL_50_26]OGS25024.1 MAG: AAA family ATPase [Elusimicrobia bacterium RIFOXYB2_FULL_50_12]
MPLALRMTPHALDDFMGQEEILGPGKLLRRAIESDRLGSAIFFGPPGTGKSALARIIAQRTNAHFEETNAVTTGVAEIRKLLEHAKQRLRISSRKTILLLDEIHHFNRTQQDALLPDVEKGVITLIGITTENPSFYINAALLSRSLLFEFKALPDSGLATIAKNALKDKESGLGNYQIRLQDDALDHLVKEANGDARRLLNALEIGALSTAPGKDGTIFFDKTVAAESMQKKLLLYDKSGDEHYDHVSAFIKSMRGSDPDAALYWMAKMLAAGEDPRFLARRIIICAAEDVGNADPQALILASSALAAIEFIGMPEARIPLAQAVTYIATAPKSNAAYLAVSRAQEEARTKKPRPVPLHLKDANLDASSRGHGKGYLYPHDFPGHFVAQEYFPEAVVFYEPTSEGYEARIKERLENWRKQRKHSPADEAVKK